MPTLSNIIGENFISTSDLTSRYFQIAMKPEGIAKTALITSNDYCACKRMSLALSGPPSTFRKAMNTIHKSLLDKVVLVYLDDIIVMAATFEEDTKEVFTLFRNAGLAVRLEKCKFLRNVI